MVVQGKCRTTSPTGFIKIGFVCEDSFKTFQSFQERRATCKCTKGSEKGYLEGFWSDHMQLEKIKATMKVLEKGGHKLHHDMMRCSP